MTINPARRSQCLFVDLQRHQRSFIYVQHLSELDRKTVPANVNITPTASGDTLKQDVEEEAQKHGLTPRGLVAAIYKYAVDHQDEFTGGLRGVRRPPGQHIGATVDDEIAKKLTAWAKSKSTPRGVHCKYILEKALEMKLPEKLNSSRRP